jgi:hypothetical protein
MHHHEYSFLCEWLCGCEIKRPGRTEILRKVNAPALPATRTDEVLG